MVLLFHLEMLWSVNNQNLLTEIVERVLNNLKDGDSAYCEDCEHKILLRVVKI